MRKPRVEKSLERDMIGKTGVAGVWRAGTDEAGELAKGHHESTCNSDSVSFAVKKSLP